MMSRTSILSNVESDAVRSTVESEPSAPDPIRRERKICRTVSAICGPSPRESSRRYVARKPADGKPLEAYPTFPLTRTFEVPFTEVASTNAVPRSWEAPLNGSPSPAETFTKPLVPENRDAVELLEELVWGSN